MKKKYRIPFAFCITLFWFLLIYFTAGIIFETNDDRLFSEILSGSMTGFPQAHTYYINYILSFPLSLLYRITVSVPWYGGCLVLFQFLCWVFLTDAFLSRCKNPREFLLSLLLCGVLYAAGFYMISNIQFTSTAALLAIIGYLCFLLYQDGKKRYFVFFLLEFLSFLLRDKSMLMIQPMGFAVLAGYYFTENRLCEIPAAAKKERLQKCRPLINAALILLTIVIIGKTSDILAYHDDGWKEYKKINDAVTEITDYAVIPEYQEAEPVLREYQVTEKQYLAFSQYTMIEENLSGDCLSKVAKIAARENASPDISEILRGIWNSYATKDFWSLNHLLLLCWIVLAIYICLRKSFSLCIPLLGLFVTRSVLWGFLLYEGRTPPRVMFPLYFGEIAFLLCLFFLDVYQAGRINPPFSAAQRGRAACGSLCPPPRVFRIFSALLLLFCLSAGAAKTLTAQYRDLSEKNAVQSVYIEGMHDLVAYCNAHADNRYFIDASSLIYYRGSAFDAELYGKRNAVITGCWYSGAPVLYQYEKDYFSGCKTVYLLTSADMEMQSGMVVAYLEELFQSAAYIEDSFTVSNGGNYLVYGFDI